MSTPDFTRFSFVFHGILQLPSHRALRLRKALGKAIDSQFAGFSKGSVQQMKTRFVKSALAMTKVQWGSSEPHKIVSNLKNNGNGEESVAMSLLFSCCCIFEFQDIRKILAIEINKLDHYDAALFLSNLTPRIYFADFIAIGHSVDKKNDEQLIYISELNRDNDQYRSETAASKRDTAFEAFPEPTMNKHVGRSFVENQLYSYAPEVSRTSIGTLSIIDIDDMTKLNHYRLTPVGSWLARY